MKPLTLLTGAALFAIAGISMAQDTGRPGRPDPTASETRQQALARVDAMFARLDANHDGRFTTDEARGMGERHHAEMQQHMFDRLDANHDGSISRDEFNAAHAMRGGAEGPGGHNMGMGPPPGGPGGPEGHRGMGPGGHGGMGMRMLGDQGVITLEQMRARALERFDRADTNHDGVLTPAEREAARAQRAEHRE